MTVAASTLTKQELTYAAALLAWSRSLEPKGKRGQNKQG